VRDLIMLVLLTGARKRSLLSMCWSDLHFGLDRTQPGLAVNAWRAQRCHSHQTRRGAAAFILHKVPRAEAQQLDPGRMDYPSPARSCIYLLRTTCAAWL